MNRYESLRGKFANREKIAGTTVIQLANPILVTEMAKRRDLDFILFDAEHGCFDAQNAIPVLHTLRLLGMPSFFRVQDCAYHLIAKAVDMGADGVMLPRVEEREQMRKAVEALYFSPIGRKGSGGYNQRREGETFGEFQRGRFLLPQIESPRGIEYLPELLGEFGQYVSGVVVGPYDLSVMLGTPEILDSEIMLQAIQRIFDAAAVAQTSCGIFCNNTQEAAMYRRMGANILWLSSELDFFMDGFARGFDALAGIQ